MINPNHALGNIKLSNIVSPMADDREIDLLAQLGVRYAYTWCVPMKKHYDDMARLRDRLAAKGITLYNAGDYVVCKAKDFHLGTPERDHAIEAFIEMLEVLARLGIYNTTFTWEPDQVWSSPDGPTRGGAMTRFVDQRALEREGVRHGRIFEKEELWDHFTYFIRRVIPEAERLGMRLALHPNDPPVPQLGGVDCLITSMLDYERAFSIANSHALGMEFCCGCWLEGGTEGFGDIEKGIRKFVSDNRVIITHFRNVGSTLPVFTETFIDDGYADMYRLMRVFYEAGYAGTLIYDHTPLFEKDSDRRAETAFAVGYIKALMAVASHEVLGA